MLYITSEGKVNPPKDLMYTTVVELSGTLVRYEGATHLLDINEEESSYMIPKHSYWVLRHSNIEAQAHADWITQGLKRGNLRAVCDGSFQPKL